MSEKTKNVSVVLLFLALILLNVYVFVSPYLPKPTTIELYVLPNYYDQAKLDKFVASLKKDIGKVTIRYSDITDADAYNKKILELIKNPSSSLDIVMVYDRDDLIPGSRERLVGLLPYFQSVEGTRVLRPNPGIPIGFAITVSSDAKEKAVKLINALSDSYDSLI